MRKKFNITGWCDANRHFVADTSIKFKQSMRMIEEGEYFTINRPHQYGKTTMLRLLTQQLNASEEWMAIRVSFEGMDDEMFSGGKLFSADRRT